jgi:hypothetical protein
MVPWYAAIGVTNPRQIRAMPRVRIGITHAL